MNDAPPPHPAPPLSDSPWFWLWVFCGAALLGTFVIGPKFARRQAQIERKFQGRQRAEQAKRGQEPSTRLSRPDAIWVGIAPVRWALGIAFCAGWLIFWRRARRIAAEERAPAAHEVAPP